MKCGQGSKHNGQPHINLISTVQRVPIICCRAIVTCMTCKHAAHGTRQLFLHTTALLNSVSVCLTSSKA